jgi:tetratricopeptide (TPR) repeat protein
MLAAYLVQGLTGLLEAASSVMYWLLLGVGTSFVLHRLEPAPVVDRKSALVYIAVISGGLIVAGIYAYRFSLKVAQDYTLRQAEAYSLARPDITDKKLSWLGQSSRHDAYYQDRIGFIYMQRLNRRPSMQHYQLANRYFLKARKLNEYDPYIRFHLIKTDALALRFRLIKQPTKEALLDLDEIVRMDPNNPTVYQARAEMYAALGKAREARDNLGIMKKIRNPKK